MNKFVLWDLDDDPNGKRKERKKSNEGTEFYFNADNANAVGMPADKTRLPLEVGTIEEQEARGQQPRIRRKVYAGDRSIIHEAPPPGKHWIPADAHFAPGTKEQAREMLQRAEQKQHKQRVTRYARAMEELFSGDFNSVL